MGSKSRKPGLSHCHSKRSEESAVFSEGCDQSVAPFLPRSSPPDGDSPKVEASYLADFARSGNSQILVAPSLSRSLRQDGDFSNATRRPPTNLRHAQPPKRRGEIAELAFMRKAISLGFGVAKPWGDRRGPQHARFSRDGVLTPTATTSSSTPASVYGEFRSAPPNTNPIADTPSIPTLRQKTNGRAHRQPSGRHRRLHRPARSLVRRAHPIRGLQKSLVLSPRQQEGKPLRTLPRSLKFIKVGIR